MRIETMTVRQVCDEFRKLGIGMTDATVQRGIQQDKFPFGLCIEGGKQPVYRVFRKPFWKWVFERATFREYRRTTMITKETAVEHMELAIAAIKKMPDEFCVIDVIINSETGKSKVLVESCNQDALARYANMAGLRCENVHGENHDYIYAFDENGTALVQIKL